MPDKNLRLNKCNSCIISELCNAFHKDDKSIKDLSNTIIRLTDIMIQKLDNISIHLVNIYNKLK